MQIRCGRELNIVIMIMENKDLVIVITITDKETKIHNAMMELRRKRHEFIRSFQLHL